MGGFRASAALSVLGIIVEPGWEAGWLLFGPMLASDPTGRRDPPHPGASYQSPRGVSGHQLPHTPEP